jgi:hypothetical protein
LSANSESSARNGTARVTSSGMTADSWRDRGASAPAGLALGWQRGEFAVARAEVVVMELLAQFTTPPARRCDGTPKRRATSPMSIRAPAFAACSVLVPGQPADPRKAVIRRGASSRRAKALLQCAT